MQHLMVKLLNFSFTKLSNPNWIKNGQFHLWKRLMGAEEVQIHKKLDFEKFRHEYFYLLRAVWYGMVWYDMDGMI